MRKKSIIVRTFIMCFCLASFMSYDVFATEGENEIKAESFEGEVKPIHWKGLDGSELELSQRRFKHGNQSLKWMWTGESKVQVIEPDFLKEVGEKKPGGMKLWIYNENPIDDVLTFKLGTAEQLEENNAHYQFDFGLDFEGWRLLWVKFSQEGHNASYTGEANEPLDILQVESPKTSGNVYFDLLEFEEKMIKSRSADYQMPKEGVADIEDAMYWDKAYHYSKMEPSLPLPKKITEKQINDFKTISKRYEDWIYGVDIDLKEEPMQIRYEALQKFISEGVDAYEKLNIVRHSDGRITGVSLFSSRDPYLPKLGEDVSKKVLMPLVFDYKINGNEESKEKFFKALDHMYDQGWAEGSGLGTMDHESNKHNGYFHAIYLMKEELRETGRLERERGTFGWQTLFNKMFETEFTDVTADEFRTKFMYNLLYVLLMDDTPEKVQYMNDLVNYYNQALKIAPGYAGTIKSDYTFFHHRGTYLSAYGPNAMNMAALIAYFTSNTEFQLSEESMHNVREILLNARIYANKYHVPLGTSGRLPDVSGTLINFVPAYAYMALAADPIDAEMASAFMRLWEPDSSDFKEKLFTQANTYRVDYTQTLGGLQLALDLAKEGYPAEESPTGNWVYPYSAMAIHRQNDWLVSVKGHSQYVWDFEGANKFDPQTLTTLKENVFGRYQSHGSMQILDSGGSIDSGYDINNGWDWNRWPGTTTKHLPLSELTTPGGNENHRLFTDQVFVGGVTNQNKQGIFAMKYHDTHFDPSFTANKTVFFLNDKIICLGSDINNTDDQNHTETTLFQSAMKESTMPFWFNSTKEITSEKMSKEMMDNQPVWMMDPYKNGYYVPNGKDLRVERGVQNSRDNKDTMDTTGNYTTAWIDHGTSPTEGGYEYAIKVKTTPEEMQAFAKDPGYTVLQKDHRAHIVQSTENERDIIGYAIMDETSKIDHGYLQNVSDPCMVMTDSYGQNEMVLSMSEPDLRLPKFDKHVDITSDNIVVEGTMKTVEVTLRGAWKLKQLSDQVRIISSSDQATTIAFDSIDGMTNTVELVKSN